MPEIGMADSTVHSIKMGRANDEIRDRESVNLTPEESDRPKASRQPGQNYIRPHIGLRGKSSSEAIRITIKRGNRVVSNSSEYKICRFERA
jgi:hypothetical protein